MHTINAAVQILGNHIDGFMILDVEGQPYERKISVDTGLDPARLDPPYIRAILLDGVTELATLALGRSPHHHGWAMPYRKDGLMVFEFNIDSMVCQHGFSLNSRCPVED